MIYFLLLASVFASVSSTQLYLSSPNSTKKSIPLVKTHPYSCELVYSKVHENLLNVSITKIPEYIEEAKITIFFNLESLKNISE